MKETLWRAPELQDSIDQYHTALPMSLDLLISRTLPNPVLLGTWTPRPITAGDRPSTESELRTGWHPEGRQARAGDAEPTCRCANTKPRSEERGRRPLRTENCGSQY